MHECIVSLIYSFIQGYCYHAGVTSSHAKLINHRWEGEGVLSIAGILSGGRINIKEMTSHQSDFVNLEKQHLF